MNILKTSTRLPSVVVMLSAVTILFAATQGALAKNGGSDHKEHSKTSDGSSNRKSEYKDKDKHKDKDGDKYSDKDKHKDKDKDGDKYSDKGTGTIKAPIIVNGGFVRDKLPNGTPYYRRATQAELDMASKGNGGATATSGGSTPGTGTGTAGNTPPPADPVAVVRDHRPGGNAADPVPGSIIRDHRNGADGKPVVVVSSSGGVTVTRPATDAELQKAGLQPKPAPAPVYAPIGASGGGR
jgi:hypothetical protein